MRLQKNNRLNIFLALIMSIFLLAGCSSDQLASSMLADDSFDSPLVVKVLDIGQGDAILIKHGDKYSMIDTADIDKRDEIVRLLKQEHVDRIENLIITHPHADHLGGAWAIMNNFPVERVYDDGLVYNSNTYKTYIKTMKKYKIPRTTLKADTELDFGNDIKFVTYAPGAKYITNEQGKYDANNNSIVGKLIYGDFTMMFTGDAEKEEEKIISSKYKDKLRSKILKVGHHGSKTSSTNEFLNYVQPEVAVISAGLDNKYHHPHQASLKRLTAILEKVHNTKNVDQYIFRTDEQGTVSIKANKDGRYAISTSRNYVKDNKTDKIAKVGENIKDKAQKLADGDAKKFTKEMKQIKNKVQNGIEDIAEVYDNSPLDELNQNENVKSLKEKIRNKVDESIEKNLKDIQSLDKVS